MHVDVDDRRADAFNLKDKCREVRREILRRSRCALTIDLKAEFDQSRWRLFLERDRDELSGTDRLVQKLFEGSGRNGLAAVEDDDAVCDLLCFVQLVRG